MIVLLILISLGILVFLFEVFYIYQKSFIDTRKKSDIILVLGALPNVKGSSKTNPCLVARVKHGILLFEQGYGKKILLSGGRSARGVSSESSTMNTMVRDRGISADKIILESHAHSTFENIVFTKNIMDKNNFHSVLIVTDPVHMPRTALIARKLGLNFSVSPAINSPCSQNILLRNKFLFTEALAILVYLIMKRL